MVGGSRQKSNEVDGKGPTRQRPFRLPPKVPIVPEILGRAPSAEPRIAHLGEAPLHLDLSQMIRKAHHYRFSILAVSYRW